MTTLTEKETRNSLTKHVVTPIGIRRKAIENSAGIWKDRKPEEFRS